ncbi:hypothetical protein H0H92_000466, partial [Tricholoma furcatifolium]
MPSVTDVGSGDPGLSLQDPTVTALITRLKPLLCDDEQADARKRLMRKTPSEAQPLLDILQKARIFFCSLFFHLCLLQLLDLSGLESSFCRNILLAIQWISSRTGLYPTCYELKDIVLLDENPVDGGGFADVFCGMYKDQKVCLKALRLRPDSEINHKRLLKENVLVDSTGRAHLADFGIASASNSEIVAWTTQTMGAGKGGTTHFRAPELVHVNEDDDEGVIQRNTAATDIYAWACVCFEIFTGKRPFHSINDNVVIAVKISRGHRPRCPSPSSKPWTEWGLTGDIWAWIELCWHQDSQQRPSAAEVTQYLRLLLLTDARQAPETTLILPSQFRSRMSQGLHATDVETLDHILCSVELDSLTEAPYPIDDKEATESPTPPTDINEGLTRKILSPPPAKPFHLLLNSPKDKEASTDQFVENGRQGDLVLLIVGPSGAGKTLFVSALFGNGYDNRGLKTTSHIQCYYGSVQGRRVCIIDTPGFRDNVTVDNEILRRISQWFSQSYPADVKRMGIIYLHDITHIGVTERMRINLHSLRRLRGTDAASEILFVTTMWNKVLPKVGEHGEHRLREKYWNDLPVGGFMMHRFDGTRDSALAILEMAVGRKVSGYQCSLGNVTSKVIRSFFSSNISDKPVKYVSALPINKDYEYVAPLYMRKKSCITAHSPPRPNKTDALPHKPLKANQKIEIETKDIIIAVIGTVEQDGKQSFIDDALGDGYDQVDTSSRDVHLFVMCSPISATGNIFLVYTTGTKMFIDSLRTVINWLSSSCSDKRKLSGLIYLEDLSTTRPSQISQEDLIFLNQKVECIGQQNVVVATLEWKDNICTERLEEYHQELMRLWSSFVEQRASVVRLAASGKASRDAFYTSWDVFRLIIMSANDTATPPPARENASNELAIRYVTTDVAASENSRPGLDGPTIALLASKLKLTLEAVDAYKRLLHLESSDAQTVLDTFQKLLDLSSLNVPFRRNVLVATQRISTRTGLWPAFYQSGKDVLEEQRLVADGGSADIYRADFQGQRVALKVLRRYWYRDPMWNIFVKEAILWSQLTHPNVLPLYGLFRFGYQMSMVSPWMDDGDITRYLRNHPSIPRLPLAADVANGLSYLHDLGIIHGDLKSDNVLIDPAGRARLTDFSLSSVADSNIVSWTSQSSGHSRGGSIRWMAPELLNYDDEDMAYNTTASDVYAWGCVCLEIFTSEFPWAHLAIDAFVLQRVLAGYHLERPPDSSRSWTEWGLTETIWSLMENCWRRDPEIRLSAAEIVQSLTPLLPESDTRPPTSSEISPVAFRRSMGATLSTDDVEAFDRVLKKAGIEFTMKEANQIGLKLRPGEQLGDDPDEMSTLEVEEKNVRSDQLLENSRETDIVIVTIGPTGSGKSTFISYLAGQVIGLAEQRSESTTTQIQHLIIPHPTDESRRIILVDTPGFDDSYTPDFEILERVATWIGQSYNTATKFTGVVYLHAMNQPRMFGTAQRTLNVLDQLMGGSATKNIVLATTTWGDV